jgi:hypothetical protein
MPFWYRSSPGAEARVWAGVGGGASGPGEDPEDAAAKDAGGRK